MGYLGRPNGRLVRFIAIGRHGSSITRRRVPIHQPDLITEGIAYDAVDGALFVSSTYRRMIVRVDAYEQVSDFVEEGAAGHWEHYDTNRRRRVVPIEISCGSAAAKDG